MHVLIVSALFPPEPVTSAMTSEQLALGLVESGHKVTVIAPFPNRPEGRLYDGYTRSFRKITKTRAGYTLLRCFSILSPKPTLGGRFLENLSFGITSTINAMSIKPDVVYANTWPIFASGLLFILCAIRGLPIVFNIQDIHPEAAIQLGKISMNGLVPQVFKYIDGLIARRSDALIMLSESFADFYQNTRGVPQDRIHVVYNWMDEQKIKPGLRTGVFRNKHGITEETFVVMYAGNVGEVANVQTVIRAASLLKDHKNILFLILGDGSNRPDCEALAHKLELTNIRFIYPLRLDQVSETQAAADLMVLPTHKSGALTSVPSKLIAYMLSGKPVLAGVNEQSDTARIIRDASCGYCVTPEHPDEMAAEIRRVVTMDEELARMGKNARRYALVNLSRKTCVRKIISVLESVANI